MNLENNKKKQEMKEKRMRDTGGFSQTFITSTPVHNPSSAVSFIY